jgi:Spy/CpxP family protein refolding chaperone
MNTNRLMMAIFSVAGMAWCITATLANDAPVMRQEPLHAPPQERHGSAPMKPPLAFEGDGIWAEQLLDDSGLRMRIGLTADQLEALSRRREATIERRQELIAERQSLAMDLARLMVEEEIDEDEVFQRVEALGQVQTELAKLRMRFLLDIRKDLTREQFRRLQHEARNRVRDRVTNERQRPANEPRGQERIRWFQRGEKGRTPGEDHPPLLPPRP